MQMIFHPDASQLIKRGEMKRHRLSTEYKQINENNFGSG